jgi:hypothetical protein
MKHLVGYLFTWDYQRSMIDLMFMKSLAAPRAAGSGPPPSYRAAR